MSKTKFFIENSSVMIHNNKSANGSLSIAYERNFAFRLIIVNKLRIK